MFTGIIECMGVVRRVEPLDRAVRLTVAANGFSDGMSDGESVCVSGVCLTLVSRARDEIGFDVVEETLQRTTLGALQPGDAVNLEKAVSLSDRLGGHLVQGHVDAVGVVKEIEIRGVERWLCIESPPATHCYVVEKGSIAVDGVSLTVASIKGCGFNVAIIPHTAAVTTLGSLQEEQLVNLEVDILAKYVEKLTRPYMARRSD